MAADPGCGFRGLKVSRRSRCLLDRPSSRWNPADISEDRLALRDIHGLERGRRDTRPLVLSSLSLGQRRADAQSALAPLLKDRDTDVQIAAAEAILDIGGHRRNAGKPGSPLGE